MWLLGRLRSILGDEGVDILVDRSEFEKSLGANGCKYFGYKKVLAKTPRGNRAIDREEIKY